MRQSMKFSRLSLLSRKERRGLQIEFKKPQTLLVAGNGFGKSAILKSLYETLGAKPHKVDKPWQSAEVTSLLEFSIDGDEYAALKVDGTYSVFDRKGNRLISTNHVVAELSPFYAELFDFRLVLADKKDQIRTPPPSYLFAPFYVDQDRGWQKPWDSFKDFGMFPGSAKALSEYHSGLKANEYYKAKAERDRASVSLVGIGAEQRAVAQALEQFRNRMQGAVLTFDLAAFTKETDQLVAESQILHREQAYYRTELARLNEEHQLWQDHVAVIDAGLREVSETFSASIGHPPDVECPMCGQHYNNHIADQFDLKADESELLLALESGRAQVSSVSARIAEQRRALDRIGAVINDVQAVLAIRHQQVTFKDVIKAEGRNEAVRVLQEQLGSLDSRCGEIRRLIEDCEIRMKAAISRDRKRAIEGLFVRSLIASAENLDVRLSDKKSIAGVNMGRGSEGPRALAAYYYAFLHVVHEYGSSAYCPIVIDAPNQQGQDRRHLPKMMNFLLTQMPPNSQVIIASEAVTGAYGDAVDVQEIGWRKDQVLREAEYARVAQTIAPYIRIL
ncbi:hypothetical protein [Rhodoplanes sp. SY1]|uniref:hypothetical protein n=1 Tax=Rhodoplanes sp. SY1 TaxID=3166646 RepID=UPI0038B4AC32